MSRALAVGTWQILRVLVLNGGSFSLKFRLCEIAGDDRNPVRIVLGSVIERIGSTAMLHLTLLNLSGTSVADHERQVTEYTQAVQWSFAWLQSGDAPIADASLFCQCSIHQACFL